MSLRWPLFLALTAAHGAAVAFGAQTPLAPAVAGSVYLPLLALQALGLPVFGATPSGGWPAPSAFGWAAVALLWLALWWAVAAGVQRLLRA